MSANGLQLLHVHQKATITIKQHGGCVALHNSGTSGIGQAIADRAKLANGQEIDDIPLTHVRRVVGAMPRRVHHHPVFG